MIRVIGWAYEKILRPFLFLFEPEKIHDVFISIGHLLGRYPLPRFLITKIFCYEDSILETAVGGLRFKNPVGLAAGFDKNGKMIKIMPSVGFGFMEVGSITGQPCLGNAKPRIWRLPKEKSLVVNYGLTNDGAEVVAERFSQKIGLDFKIGASVAMTNCQENLDPRMAIADYVRAFRILEPVADFLTINISCPNAEGGKMFMEPEPLENLLMAIDLLPTKKAVLIKMSPDIEGEKLDQILEIISRHRVDGLVCSNLTKEGGGQKGGLSGKLVFDKSNKLIDHCYKKVGQKMFIVGCGGVMSAEDAYLKIKLGATLIQLVTGMIYEGPQLIGEINRGLARRLKADGFGSILEAVGTGNK